MKYTNLSIEQSYNSLGKLQWCIGNVGFHSYMDALLYLKRIVDQKILLLKEENLK